MSFYLSRAFVEFGPFPAAELLSFFNRGILQDTDYVREEGSSDWLHANDWAASQTAPAPAAPVPVAKVKKPAAKKAVAAPAPAAKKAPAKKAKKTA
jgi:hypothetical protein